MKRIIPIALAGLSIIGLAWTLAPNKALSDLEVYTEKGKTYFRGVWTKGENAQSLKAFESPEDFENSWEEMAKSGFSLRDIGIDEKEDAVKVYAVYEKLAESATPVKFNSWAEFESDWKTKEKAGQELIDFDYFYLYGEEVFYGVYGGSGKKMHVYTTKTWGEMENTIKEYGTKKRELKDLDRAKIDGDWHYIAFFSETDKPLTYKAFKVSSNEAVERQASANAKKGEILIEADGFEQGNAISHLTVYVKQPQPNALFSSESWEEFEAKFKELSPQ